MHAVRTRHDVSLPKVGTICAMKSPVKVTRKVVEHENDRYVKFMQKYFVVHVTHYLSQ